MQAEPVSEVPSNPKTATVPGMYRIRFQKPGGRIILESQMKLFSRHRDPFEGFVLQFSARPRLGTQTFKAGDIISMYRVADDAEVYVNWDPRKPGKPQSWPYVR